jgi:hypothetical protein
MTVAEAVTLIGAVTAAVVAICTAAVSVYVAIQAGKTHALVNGVSTLINQATRAQGQAEGRLAEVKGTDTPPAEPVEVAPAPPPEPNST